MTHLSTLPPSYDSAEAEARWQRLWEESKLYAWEPAEPRENTFVIDTPPPTVSGVLHMGHIFSYTQADFVARYQRMSGKTVFYPMGFDDNGLPTERLVEKAKGKKAAQYPSREAFIAECEQVSAEARQEFRRLFTSVALSVDWAQEYHTIGADERRISQLSFLDLYHKSRAYRALQPFYWDPVDQTAIAQAEIEDKEVASHANYITFGIVPKGTPAAEIKWAEIEKVTLMTTRPELLGACVALMCHPDDAAKFAGKQAVTPLFGVVVDIVADEKVNKEKGTGLVMCCTFGDDTDIAWWREHKLPMRVILNKYGKLELNDKPWLKPTAERAFCATLDEKWATLQNLKTSNPDPKSPGAREKTIELLREVGALVKQESITHSVKCAERSGAPLEILPTHQWFVKLMDQKEELKAKSAECAWHPPFMKHRMDQWIDGLSSDWCISRQRYFGVPFPVWYVEGGETILARPEDLPVNPLTDLPHGFTLIAREESGVIRAKRDATGEEVRIIPDRDVMDTWATSSVSPQISARGIAPGYVLDAPRYAQLFPADLRPQAHEIIRTWAFYTLAKAHLHADTIPWKNLMISGWCLAADKTKMSKSKGNVVTPVELIQSKGADAVRYWASTSRLGADTAFSEDVLKIGKKLVTKLWNAGQFVAKQLAQLSHTPTGSAAETVADGRISEALDLWLLGRVQRAVVKATDDFERFEYADARAAVDDVFWNDFCDNYLELVKGRAYSEGVEVTPHQQQSALLTLYFAFEALLKLYAPFIPHVTEELYTHLYASRGVVSVHARGIVSIHARGAWPASGDYPAHGEAEAAGAACVAVLAAIRKAKSERSLSIKYPLDAVVLSPGAAGGRFEALAGTLVDLKAATSAAAISWRDAPHDAGLATEDGAYTLDVTFAASGNAGEAA